MLNERSRRIADLFVEGTALYFGTDETDQPRLIWINKLNSFEAEEVRKDAVVARGLRIGELGKDDCPELVAIRAELNAWSDAELRNQRADQLSNEHSVDALNDIESAHPDLVARVRRGPELLTDREAPPDDPARKELEEAQEHYLKLFNEAREKLHEDALADLDQTSHEDLVTDFLVGWREQVSLNAFLAERRTSELFYAMRDCCGTEDGRDTEGRPTFDHAGCNHTARLLAERSQVYELPEPVLERAASALESLSVSARDAGNLAAPESSSASSERPNAEEPSTPSTPEETSPDAPTT